MMDIQFITFLNDAERNFSGWDFSYVTETGRLQTGTAAWSYGSTVIPYIRGADTMLDMGTGGGELLSNLRPFPKSIYATEGFAPNVQVARERLEPLGVIVEVVDEDEVLPFPDQFFDLVINKHESYSPLEVRRVLKDGGYFITQQVGGSDSADINRALGVPVNDEFADWNLESASAGLLENGFQIIRSEEDAPVQRFYDIGALIYYLSAIPWQVPGFHPDKYRDELYRVHQEIQENGYLEVKQSRFIILARAV
ncbi:class I SAM-dependent methyltransferase [Peribacillus sp. SCS-26]|uniref:class I SAM-dependent methyltransferase n=1 Tax=Paraperibacillus marinus TaxID=3115295 RepID=UPI0039066FE4